MGLYKRGLENHTGVGYCSIKGEVMSALCLVSFSGEKLDFSKLNNLANEIVLNAVLNKYAVFFDDCYAEQILENKPRMISALISCSFFDRNADDFLNLSDFAYDTEGEFKRDFFNRFHVLKLFIEILFSHQIDYADIYITEDSNEDLESYICVETTQEDMLEKLFETFMLYAFKNGYTFPDIKIQIQKN